MKTFIKTSFETLKSWALGFYSVNGFINGGWIIAGILLLFFGYPFISGISFGIFIEKNRSQLLKLYKKLK